jgi:serine/threonine protein kinase
MGVTSLESSDPIRIASYTLVSRLGSGATGIVYEATRDDGLAVALKVIRRELADLPQVRERLRREAESLQRVASTRCAEVYEVDADSTPPFLAMELISGRDLSAEVLERGPLRGAMARTVFVSLTEALEAIHSAGVIHRDFKPSNVLIGGMGVRVVDFGISAVLDVAHLTSTGVVVGTASWMSPEQIDGRELTEATDVFNLGLVMSFCLTGKHPFGEGRPDALMYRIMHADPDLSAIPVEYQSIIERCLIKDSHTRLTLLQIGELLKNVSESGGVVIDPGTAVLATQDIERIVSSSAATSANKKVTSVTEKESNAPTKKILLLSGAGLAIAGLIGAFFTLGSINSSPESTTTTAAPTTTIAITPVFEIFREKGIGYRWDPCGGAINVGVNYGELNDLNKEYAIKGVTQAISEVADISGLPFVYAGATSSMPRMQYREGRRGSQALLVSFHPSGTGIISKEENFVFNYFLSYGNVYGSWREIKTIDIQINSLQLNTLEEFIRESRRAMLTAMGLAFVDSPNELMGAPGNSVTLLDEFGPGDIRGMSALGATQGCFR